MTSRTTSTSTRSPGGSAPESWPTFASRVEANTDRLLDLFAEHGVKATFFVLGWVAERNPALVRRIADAGHELGSHSHWHRLVFSLSPDEFREDLRRARGAIGEAAGRHGPRLPGAQLLHRASARSGPSTILAEEGYDYDASIFPVRHDVYGIPDAPGSPHVIPLPIRDHLSSGPVPPAASAATCACRSAAAISGWSRTR